MGVSNCLLMFIDVFSDVHIIVYAECSNHGTCHRYYGQCACEVGFHGVACQDISDNQSLNQTIHTGNFFTGSMMQLQLLRHDRYATLISPKEYNYVDIKLNEAVVTKIRGDGMLYHHGKMFLEGDLLVGSKAAKSLFTKRLIPTLKRFSLDMTTVALKKVYEEQVKQTIREDHQSNNVLGLGYYDTHYAHHYERLSTVSRDWLLSTCTATNNDGVVEAEAAADVEEMEVHYESANVSNNYTPSFILLLMICLCCLH